MAVSEQVPSAIGLGVLVDTDESVKATGGFMIQVMPVPMKVPLILLNSV